METLSEKKDANVGKRYKLIVRSAEEAVRIIRDKLGDHAKVLSVRQVGGEGLKRFISSPKLEVIAEVKSPDTVDTSEEGQVQQVDNIPVALDEKKQNDSPVEIPQIIRLLSIQMKNLIRNNQLSPQSPKTKLSPYFTRPGLIKLC